MLESHDGKKIMYIPDMKYELCYSGRILVIKDPYMICWQLLMGVTKASLPVKTMPLLLQQKYTESKHTFQPRMHA